MRLSYTKILALAAFLAQSKAVDEGMCVVSSITGSRVTKANAHGREVNVFSRWLYLLV